jgi:2-aminoadipate transaminase
MVLSTANDAAIRSLKERLASRTSVFSTSIWTDILRQFQQHPDPVYFGDGAPAPEMMPLEQLRAASMKAWDDAPGALAYGEQKGYEPLRELIAERVAQRGMMTSADNILITGGATQGLDIAARVFVEEGDAIIVELPTFLGAIEIFELYGVQIVGVAGDEHGMDMSQLAATLDAYPNTKVIYTIPTFQNPSGTTMPLDRRERMLELANRHNVAIFEDDPYGELQYSGENVHPIRALDNRVLHFGTFSKTIAPGIRTGYIIAPDDIIGTLLSVREVTDISNDRIMMRTVYHTAKDFLDGHVAQARELYKARRDAMLEALDEHMPEGVRWSKPDGGFFVWITLPDDVRHHTLFDDAAKNGVIFFPGKWFDPNKQMENTVRLSFSTVPEERIRLGIERLGKTLRDELAR